MVGIVVEGMVDWVWFDVLVIDLEVVFYVIVVVDLLVVCIGVLYIC